MKLNAAMRGAAGVAVTVATILLGTWIFLLPPAVRYATRDALGRLGVSAQGGRVSIGLDRAAISEIALPGQGSVSLVARYSLGSLRHGRFDTLEIADASFHGKIRPDGSLAIDGYRPTATRADRGSIAIPAAQVSIRHVSLALDTPIGPASVTGTGTLSPRAEGLQLLGDLDAKIAGLELHAPVKTAYGPPGLTLDLGPIRSQQTTGAVALHVRSAGAGAGAKARGTLELRDFGFATPRLAIEGANGTIAFARLSPLATDGRQHLTAKRVTLGQPLGDPSVDFALADGHVLAIADAHGALMGGQLAIENQSIDLRSEQQDVTLRLQGIDLAQLLALANLTGLSATGKLDGTVPIRHKNDIVQIDNAVMTATEPGVLRYDPADPPSFLKDAQSAEIALLREALKDFHYQKLTVTISGALGAEEDIKMALTGSNPALYGGKTIEMNLDVSGSLDKIARWSVRSFASPFEAVRKSKDRQ